MNVIQQAIARVINPTLPEFDANLPELYEDLQVRRAEAIYSDGEFDGFLFDLGIKAHAGADPSQRYKFVRFLRLTRVTPIAKDQRGNEGPHMLDAHRDVLAALRQNGVHSITLIGNDPDRLGTVMCYGVQAAGATPEEAKERSRVGMVATKACLLGSFRQMVVRGLNADEVLWLNTNLSQWRQVAVFRGTPQPRRNVSSSLTVTLNGINREVAMEEQIEEFVRGLSNHNFLLVLLASPLSEDAILRLLRRISVELGKVASDVERTKTVSAGVALPIGFSGQMGTQHGVGNASSHSNSEGVTTSLTHGTSTGESHGVNQQLTTSHGTNVGYSHGATVGDSHGTNLTSGVSTNHSFAQNQGSSENQSFSSGQTTSQSATDSFGTSQNQSTGWGTADGQSASVGGNTSTNHSTSIGYGANQSTGTSVGKSDGSSASLIVGTQMGTSESTSANQGTSINQNASTTVGTGNNWGTGTNHTQSANFNNSVGTNTGQAFSSSAGVSNSVGSGFGRSVGTSETVGSGTSSSFGQSVGTSRGISDSTNVGVSDSTSVGRGTSYQTSQSVSDTASTGASQGFQRALTASDSFAQSYGYGQSMGVAPNFSVAISKRILDEEKRNLQGIMGAQRNRLMLAREEGAFAVSMYLLTPDEETKEAAVGLAKSAFWGTNDNGAVPVPFHALNDLSDDEQEHLLEHIRTFSACLVEEPGGESLEDHAYSTVLTPSELAVVTHPPRVDVPGIHVNLQAVPMFRIPVNADGALHLGRIISGETGEPTKHRFGFDPSRLTHTMIAGASGSGKTVTAFRLIYHWVNQPPRPVRVRQDDGSFITEQRQPGAIILDWKSDFRALANLVPQERFRYASLADPDMGFRFNPLAVPAGVKPGMHRDTVCEMLAMAYGLGIRGRGILYTDLHQLYNTPRPLRYIDPTAPADAMGTVYEYPELSRFVGMADLSVAINRRLDDVANNPRKYGNDVKDRLNVVVNRMQYFDWDGELVKIYTRDFHPDEIQHNSFYGAELQTYLDRGLLATEPCLTLEDIVRGDNVVVLEGGGLDSLSKRAIIGMLAASIFNYARCRGDGAFSPEKLLVFEEAHEVIEGSTEGMREVSGIGASIYELMFNESRSYGIRIMAICQTPSLMPPSVIANTSTFIAHNLSVDDDLELVTVKVGKDPRIDDRSFKQFLAMMPVGWAVVKAHGGRSYLDNDPVLISTAMLATVKPTNRQLAGRVLSNRS